MKITTYWNCDKCRQWGAIRHDETKDVSTLIGMIQDDHDQTLTKCPFEISKIRVANTPRLLNEIENEIAARALRFQIDRA